jgi:ABC-type Na+ efflux pump permease subunit
VSDRRRDDAERSGRRHDPEAPAAAPGTRARADGGTADSRAGRSTRVTIARREVASLRSEKTIVLALAIQLFVAAFSSFLVVGLVSLYSPSGGGFTPTVAVAGNASEDVLRAASDPGGGGAADLRRYPGITEARSAFRAEQVDAVLLANETGEGAVRVTALVPEGDVRTTVVVVAVRDTLESLERTLRDEFARQGRLPETVPVPQNVPTSPYFSFTYTVLVPLLMFLPAFISGSIAVDSLTEEVQRGTLELLLVAPVDLSTVVDAKVLSAATLAPAQALLWVALLSANGTAVANPLGLGVVVAGVATALVVGGAGIALATPDRRQAQFLYSSGVLGTAVVASLLPEHPANTVAKLAVGSATTATWVAVAGYATLGVVAYLAVRVGVTRVDPEGL